MRPAAVACALPLLLGLTAGARDRVGPAWTDPRNPVAVHFGGKRLDLWSLRPPVRRAPPPAPAGTHPIDAFLGTARAPIADPRTLARRLSFDLTGLPPTPDAVAAFAKRPDPGALADRLLASPRYGEHRARMWLDVVRYADSNGFDWDELRPDAWRYRDWVVRSFNADKPYDRFVREQLAGDEGVAGEPRTRDEQDALIATGYLRLGPWDNSAVLFGEGGRVREALMNDLVETTGSAFLGLTLSCARCHHHKTEPILQNDFYRMRAFFEPLAPRDDLAVDLAPVQARIRERGAAWTAERDRRKAARDTASGPEREAAAKALEQWEARDPSALLTRALAATDGAQAPAPTRVLEGGDPTRPGAAVVPGFPTVWDPDPAPILAPVRSGSTGRRSALAAWIARRDNPLTARVMVNRIWLQLFGEGLVATPNDFGLSGARPTHAALLDWLAVRFVEDGWSVKRLERWIVTSRAYQSRARAPRRLSAEQLRDAALTVSGSLRPRPEGGPPVWPPLPPEVIQANPALLDDNPQKTKGWYVSPPGLQGVRSVYLVQKRTVPVPFMAAFDLPPNQVSCARRTGSLVAPQAFALLNGQMAADAARAFAARVAREAGVDPDRQSAHAFRLALQRAPDPSERRACATLRRRRGLPALCRALLNVNEFVFVD